MLPVVLESTQEGLPDTEIARRVSAGDQDAVQEACLLAYRAMGKFRGDAKLSTWLVRIVVNEGIARVRKRSRRAEVIRRGGASGRDGTRRPRRLPRSGKHLAGVQELIVAR